MANRYFPGQPFNSDCTVTGEGLVELVLFLLVHNRNKPDNDDDDNDEVDDEEEEETAAQLENKGKVGRLPNSTPNNRLVLVFMATVESCETVICKISSYAFFNQLVLIELILQRPFLRGCWHSAILMAISVKARGIFNPIGFNEVNDFLCYRYSFSSRFSVFSRKVHRPHQCHVVSNHSLRFLCCLLPSHTDRRRLQSFAPFSPGNNHGFATRSRKSC